MSRADDLQRIGQALERAAGILAAFTPGEVAHRSKEGGDPLTEADTAVNEALLAILPRDGEGWLSEETVDDDRRLDCRRVWVVDPIDGTREFIQGIPEWCVSVGLVESGRAVAGGICIPARRLTVIGSLESGVKANGADCAVRSTSTLAQTEVLASRSEVKRGEWQRYADAPFRVTPTGSVAYKMALVAAGLTEATWTLVPKHEWDVAAGTALVTAAGGEVWTLEGHAPEFNKAVPKFRGLFAVPRQLAEPIRDFLKRDVAGILEGGG